MKIEIPPLEKGGILSVRLVISLVVYGASHLTYIACPIETRLRPLCFA